MPDVMLPTLRKYHNVKLYCISYQFRRKKSFRCSFYIACASQYCVGFHEKKTGCGWKEANVDGKRRIITWRFNIITGSFHSSKTD